jgi:beta-lactamase superfamily II metal-dependent hydrolase
LAKDGPVARRRRATTKKAVPLISGLLILAAVVFGLISRFADRDETPAPGPHQLRIRALDVGQGDSVLVITPAGKTVLVDAGVPESAPTIIEALNRAEVKQIDLVVATHPHSDHIGAMVKVLDAVPVKLFLDSGQVHTTQTFTRLLEKVREKDIQFVAAEAGQEFELDSGVVLHVLGPSRPWIEDTKGSELNANSVVLRLTFESFSMLLTGDSEAETEARLLDAQSDLSAKVLKVAHHGSRYSTGAAFLKAVGPEAAIISCGADNEYGHPAQPTIDRLKKIGVELYRTDLQGTITVITDGKSYRVETEHPATGDLWAGRTSRRTEGMESGGSDQPRRSGRAARSQRGDE